MGSLCCGKEHAGIYLIIRDEYEMEKAWLPSLLGEVELEDVGRGRRQVSEGAAELEALPDSDSSILEARALWASFNTPRPLGLHL